MSVKYKVLTTEELLADVDREQMIKWILHVLQVPGMEGGCENEDPIRYPGHRVVRLVKKGPYAEPEVLVVGPIPGRVAWTITETAAGYDLTLGQVPFFNLPYSFAFFEGVVLVAIDHGVRAEPEVEAALMQWFLTAIAHRAKATLRSLAMADTPEGPKRLERIGIDPETGDTYAQMGEEWVAPDGTLARASALRIVTLN